jgi:hypothetical protein
VHAQAGQGVEVDGQGAGQRLALAGAHLGDVALVQHHAADELDVEVGHAQHARRRLAHGGEGLGEQLLEVGALVEPAAEFAGHPLELGLGLGLERGARSLMRATMGWSFFSSRAFLVPKTFLMRENTGFS